MRLPRLLLLAPGFHGYARSIARAFQRCGYEIELDEYDLLGSLAMKARHKLTAELPARLGVGLESGVLAGRRSAGRVLDFRPDVLIFLRGDSVSEDVFEASERVGAHNILWLWDEVRRTRHTSSTIDRFDQLITYSPMDAQQFLSQGKPCSFVANAFDDEMIPTERTPSRGVLFIGARYPRREGLMRALVDADVPVTAVGRSWSHHPFDRLRTWEWHRPRMHTLRDVPRSTGYSLTAGSSAALNIHYDQDGFTMKTFEVPGVGGVQLIDRPDVVDLYEPGKEVLVYESEDELIDLSRRCIRDDRWGDRVREAGQKRTLAEHTFVHRARQVEQLWA